MSLACAEGDRIVADFEEPLPQRSSEQLLPRAQVLMEKAGWKISEVEAVVLSLGPGSFTGLRIGMAFAKGLNLGGGPRLLAFPTMLGWAEAVRDQFMDSGASKLSVMLDGRRGQVYRGQMTLKDGHWQEESPQSLKDLEAALQEQDGQSALVSDMEVEGWKGLRLKRKKSLAAALAALAQQRLAEDPQAADDAATMQPLYLRRSEAELLWEKRHGKS